MWVGSLREHRYDMSPAQGRYAFGTLQFDDPIMRLQYRNHVWTETIQRSSAAAIRRDSETSPGPSSTLLPQQFISSVDSIRYILEAWHQYQLQVSDIQRDLLLLGFEPEKIELFGKFLEPLNSVKARVFERYVRDIQENAVLPTLEDVNIVCDARAIFEDYPYPIPERTKMRHTRLLGFQPMLLMEIFTEDSVGRKQRFSFQMTERRFDELCDSLKRAGDQLNVFKAKTDKLVEGSG